MVFVTPRVERITLELSRVPEHRHLYATLQFHVDEPPIGPNDYTRAIFRSSNGDSEEVWGPADRLIVSLKPGFTAEDVRSRVEELGQFTQIVLQGSTFGIQILRFDVDRNQAYRMVAQWSEVSEVRHDLRGVIVPLGGRPPYGSFVDIRTASDGSPGDYKLRVTAGDTVWVTYENPVGPPISTWAVIP